MEIKLDFNENEIDMLSHTISASFVLNQKDRFSDLNSGKDLAEIIKYEKENISDEPIKSPMSKKQYDAIRQPKSTLYYINDFVSAKIFATYKENELYKQMQKKLNRIICLPQRKKASNYKCYILSDEVDMATSQWGVWVPEPFRA